MGFMEKLGVTKPLIQLPHTPQTYNDKYVVAWDFSSIDSDAAVKELTTLLNDLESAGLQTEVRAGYEQTLLIFVKAPKELLGNTVYKSRVKDWLYGIVAEHPGGTKNTIVNDAFEAEDILSVYHLVNWPKTLGGAGITPEAGQWENVKSIFPLHNEPTNQSLLRHLSKRLFLDINDLDAIRNLWGTKVAFYFAFLQTYLLFLSFPAITGVIAWLYLSKYSLSYAIGTCVWCTVFLEYWKIQEVDLGIRWNVQGIGKVKANRPEFKYEKVIRTEAGVIHYFPKWKQITRQLLQIPFVLVSALILGALIVLVFAIEVLISEGYDGPYKNLMEYVPTCLLAIALPYLSSPLEDLAAVLTKYENHRTKDNHEMSLTMKLFVLNIITNYLPILITAFIYVPFGDAVVPWLETGTKSFLGAIGSKYMDDNPTVHIDSDRLRDEVIALVVTGQVSGFLEENVVPVLKHRAKGFYREIKRYRSRGNSMLMSIVKDDPEEAKFLHSVRKQSTLGKYNVQDDIAEIVLQFGYLSLFSPVWPLIPIGFLINNIIELRTDFLKICHEFQRPAPTRTDGIGPWIAALDILTWAGSLSTGAIVHLFGLNTIGNGAWWALPITIFISEHVFLSLRAFVRFVLQRFGSEQIRKQRQQRYKMRVKHLEELEANKQAGLLLTVAERERRKSIRAMSHDSFWTQQVEDGTSAVVGIQLIQSVKNGGGGSLKRRDTKLE